MTALRKRSGRDRGYTVVEVLATMTLFAIGAAGVISMQRVTIQGGDDARHFDVATNIANQWAARLQRDAMFWTLPDSVGTLPSNIDQTQWIKDVPSDWHVPTIPPTQPTGASATSGSPAYDLLGREVAPTSNDAVFCVQFREQWIVPTPGIGAFLRAEIRVVWSRLETPAIGSGCGAIDNTVLATDKNRYHFVYVTTGIRENQSR